MFQVYVTDKECMCPSSLKQVDCECFTKVNKRVPSRISPAQKALSRLWFANNNAEASNLEKNMRLREARLYLKQSNDIVVLRYAKLWYKKSENLAKEADEEIVKIANQLQLEVVPTASTLTQRTNRLMIDDDDEESQENPEYRFDELDEHNCMAQATRSQPYNVEQNSAKRELSNYVSQTEAHFQERAINFRTQIIFGFFNTLTKTFTSERNIPIAHAGNVEEMTNSAYQPDGPGAQTYWNTYKNNFFKLYPVYQLLSNIPASSSSLERIFSEISRKVGSNRSALQCETLVVLQQGSAQAIKFMKELSEVE